MFLVLISLILALGAPGKPPAAPPTSALPATQPGLGPDEGVFLVSVDAHGGQIAYFVAGNVRHSIAIADMQAEQRLNPLWPLRVVLPKDAAIYDEGTPIGNAKKGLLQAPAAPKPDSAPKPESITATPTTYVLQLGDNLTRLAEHFGTSVDAILQTNGLANANRVYAGQTLAIPSEARIEAAPPATAAPEPVAAEPADQAAAPPTSSTYTVQPGDSAFRIARRFGVDQDELLVVNGITNPNRIYIGQVLELPGA